MYLKALLAIYIKKLFNEKKNRNAILLQWKYIFVAFVTESNWIWIFLCALEPSLINSNALKIATDASALYVLRLPIWHE